MYVIPKSQPPPVTGAQTSHPMMYTSGYASGAHAPSTAGPTVSHMTNMSGLHLGHPAQHSSFGFKVPEQHSSHSLPGSALYPQKQTPSAPPLPSATNAAAASALRPAPLHSPQVAALAQSHHMILNSHMPSSHPHVSHSHLLVAGSRRTPHTHSPHLRSPSSHLPSSSQPQSSPSHHLPSHHPHIASPSSRLMSPHQSQQTMASHPSRLHSVAELAQSSTEREGNTAPLDLSTSKPITMEPLRVRPPSQTDPPRTEVPRTDAPLDLSVKPVRKRDHDDDVIVVGGDQHIPFKARRMSEYTSVYSYHPGSIHYMPPSGYANGATLPSDAHNTMYRQTHPDLHRHSRSASRSGVIQSPQGGVLSSSSSSPSSSSSSGYYSCDPTGKPSPYYRQQLSPVVPPPGAQPMTRVPPDSNSNSSQQQKPPYTYPSPTGTPYKLASSSKGDVSSPHPPTCTASPMGNSSDMRYYTYSHAYGKAPSVVASPHAPGSSSALPSSTTHNGHRYMYPSSVPPGSSAVSRPGSSLSIRQSPSLINPNTTSGLSIPKSPRTVQQERTSSYHQHLSPSHHASVQKPPSRNGGSSSVHVIGNNTPDFSSSSPKQIPHTYPQQNHYQHSVSSRTMNTSGAPVTTVPSHWASSQHHPASFSMHKSASEHLSSPSVNQTLIRPPSRGTLLIAESPRAMSHPPSPNQTQIRQYPHPPPTSLSSSSPTAHIERTHAGSYLSVPRPGQVGRAAEVQRMNHLTESELGELNSVCISRPRPKQHPVDPGGRSPLPKTELGPHMGQQMVRILPFQQTSMAQPVRVPHPGYLMRPQNSTGTPFLQVPGPHGPHSITVSLNPSQVAATSSAATTGDSQQRQKQHQAQAGVTVTNMNSSSNAPLIKPWPTYPYPDPSRHHVDVPGAYNREEGHYSVAPGSVRKTIPVANVNPIIVQPKSPTVIHPKKMMLYQSRIESGPGVQSQQPGQPHKHSSDNSNNNKQSAISTKSPAGDGSGNNVSTFLSEALHSTFKRMLTSPECEVPPRLKSEDQASCDETAQNGDSSSKLDFSKLTRGLKACPDPIIKMERAQQIFHFSEKASPTELKIPVVPLKERIKAKDHFGRASPICNEYKKKSIVKSELDVKPKLGRPRLKTKCKKAENAKIHRYYKVKSKVGSGKVKNHSDDRKESVCGGKKRDIKEETKNEEDNDDTMEEGEDDKEYDNGEKREKEKKKKREGDNRAERRKRFSRLRDESQLKARKKRMYVKSGLHKQKPGAPRKEGKRRKENSGVVISARTRTQTAATKGVRRLSSAYNKNAAYERELKREEYRKLIKRFKRQTRQLGNRESRRVTRERLGVIFQSESGTEDDDVDEDVDEDEDVDDADDDDDEEDRDYIFKQVRRKSDDEDFECGDDPGSGTTAQVSQGGKRALAMPSTKIAADEETCDGAEAEGSDYDGERSEMSSVRENDFVEETEESQDKTLEQIPRPVKSKRGIRGRGRIFRRRGAAWYDKKRDRKKKIRVKEENESTRGADAAEANDISAQEVLSAPEMARRLVICKETGETLLHKAARLGHDDVVLYCLENGFEVNSRDNAGYTPLHETCVRGHVMAARVLIAHGADINANAHDGTRPMHDAVDNNNTEIVRMLLACGVDTKLVSFGGRNVMKLAKGDAMKEVLRGYFGDLNGANEEKGFKEIPWRFYGSKTSEDPKLEKGCALLEDAPAADEGDPCLDVEFDLCDEDHLPMYYLETVPNRGPRNYHILKDVLGRLNVTKDDFVTSHPEAEVVEHFAPCLQHAVDDDLTMASGTSDPRRKVSIVEATDDIKKLLGVETETVFWRTEVCHESKHEEVDNTDIDRDGYETSRTESPGPMETVLDPVNGFLKTQKIKDYKKEDYCVEGCGDDPKDSEITEGEGEPLATDVELAGNAQQLSCESNQDTPSKPIAEKSCEKGELETRSEPAMEVSECADVVRDDDADEKTRCVRPTTECKDGVQDLKKPCVEAAVTSGCVRVETKQEQKLIKICDKSRGDGENKTCPEGDDVGVSVCGTYVPVVTSVTPETQSEAIPSLSLEALVKSPIEFLSATNEDLITTLASQCSPAGSGGTTVIATTSTTTTTTTSEKKVVVVDPSTPPVPPSPSPPPGEAIGEAESQPMGGTTAGKQTSPSSAIPAPTTQAISPLFQLRGNDNNKVGNKEKLYTPSSPSLLPSGEKQEEEKTEGEDRDKPEDGAESVVSTSNSGVPSVKVDVSDSKKSLSPEPSDLAASKAEGQTSDSGLSIKAQSVSKAEVIVQSSDLRHPVPNPQPSTSYDSTNCQAKDHNDLGSKEEQVHSTEETVCMNKDSKSCQESKEGRFINNTKDPVNDRDISATEGLGIAKGSSTCGDSGDPHQPVIQPTQTTANCDIDKLNQCRGDANMPTKTAHQLSECIAIPRPLKTVVAHPPANIPTTSLPTANPQDTPPHDISHATVAASGAEKESKESSSGEMKKESNNNNVAEDAPDNGLPVLEKHEAEGEEKTTESEMPVEPSSDETSDDREMPKLTIQAY